MINYKPTSSLTLQKQKRLISFARSFQ